jgi:hypothetical protein
MSVARRWRIWTLTLLVTAVAIAAVVYDVTHRAATMRVTTSAAASVTQAASGTLVKAVVNLEGTRATSVYTAELCESIDETTYRETPRHIDVALTEGTKVVTGSSRDLTPGAIVHVTEMMDGEGRLRASQAVILSGYAR